MAMQIQSRFMDVCDEPIDHLLLPIKGYQHEKLVSLNEAIQPVSQFFNEIENNIFVALHNCQHPTDDLIQQESAAIHLYTMQFSGESSLHQLLNQSLRTENREELKPWFSFLKLFLTALYKLPSQNKTIWRGVKSEAFLGKHGQRTVFSIECINGKSIINHSYFKQKKNEVIPSTVGRVI